MWDYSWLCLVHLKAIWRLHLSENDPTGICNLGEENDGMGERGETKMSEGKNENKRIYLLKINRKQIIATFYK